MIVIAIVVVVGWVWVSFSLLFDLGWRLDSEAYACLGSGVMCFVFRVLVGDDCFVVGSSYRGILLPDAMKVACS